MKLSDLPRIGSQLKCEEFKGRGWESGTFRVTKVNLLLGSLGAHRGPGMGGASLSGWHNTSLAGLSK